MQTQLVNSDCIKHLKTLDDNIFDSCVTDPPYHLTSIVKRFTNSTAAKGPLFNRLAKGFMGQKWDGGDIAFTTELWKEVYRVLKPGAVLLAFSATRNYHRMAVAVEDSGFEIFDMINWIYGSGFPKRKNYLKPAHEPIVMARKGVNPSLNIEESRIPLEKDDKLQEGLTGRDGRKLDTTDTQGDWGFKALDREPGLGRYPANIIHDGLEDEWSRYFYCAKATKKEKGDTKHPTVKPVTLMRYLVKLITPKGGIVLDPFAGTGTTGEACILENKKYYLIEAEPSYFKDIETRLHRYGGLGI